MHRMSSVTVQHSYQTISKTRDTLLIGPVENCPISSTVQLLIQKLFWALDGGFKIALCVAPQT